MTAPLDLTKPVQTRDGRRAVILGVVPEEFELDGGFAIAAYVIDDDDGGIATIDTFTIEGWYLDERPCSCDLVNVGAAPPELDDDALREAISDAISDGEGNVTPYYLKHSLAQYGMKIVPIHADEATS